MAAADCRQREDYLRLTFARHVQEGSAARGKCTDLASLSYKDEADVGPLGNLSFRSSRTRPIQTSRRLSVSTMRRGSQCTSRSIDQARRDSAGLRLIREEGVTRVQRTSRKSQENRYVNAKRDEQRREY